MLDDEVAKVREYFWQSLPLLEKEKENLSQIFSDQADFLNDLNIDSLTLQDFYMRLEDHFGISIPLEDMPDLISVQAVVDYIDRLGSQ